MKALIVALALSIASSTMAQSPFNSKIATAASNAPTIRAVVVKTHPVESLGVITPLTYRIVIGINTYLTVSPGPRNSGIYEAQFLKLGDGQFEGVDTIRITRNHMHVKPSETFDLKINSVSFGNDLPTAVSGGSVSVDSRRLLVYSATKDVQGNTVLKATAGEMFFTASYSGDIIRMGIYEFSLATVETQQYLDIYYTTKYGTQVVRTALDSINDKQ